MARLVHVLPWQDGFAFIARARKPYLDVFENLDLALRKLVVVCGHGCKPLLLQECLGSGCAFTNRGVRKLACLSIGIGIQGGRRELSDWQIDLSVLIVNHVLVF